MVRRFLTMLAAEPAPESDTNTSRPPVGKAQRLKHGPTVDSSWTKYDEESGLLVGNAELMIRGAGPLDIIAYLMDAAGRHQQFRLDPHIEVRLETREVRSAHHAIIFYARRRRSTTARSSMRWCGRSCPRRNIFGVLSPSQATRLLHRPTRPTRCEQRVRNASASLTWRMVPLRSSSLVRWI
jgi:hypothetical protein